MMKSGELQSQTDGPVVQELASVLESHEFQSSQRARTLLSYVVEKALSHRSDQLKERTIGIELFHRDTAYDTGHDGIVRVAASDVRKRLINFYSRTASTRSPGIRIVLPSGSYVPVFETDEIAGPAQKKSDQPLKKSEQPLKAAGGKARQWLWLAAGLVLLGTAIGAASALVSARQTPAKNAVDPVLLEAWRPFARLDANVLLATATPLSLVMVPKGYVTYGSATYPAPPEAHPLFRQHRPLVPAAKLSMTFSDNMLGFGTMNAVVTAVNTLKSIGSSYQILPERVTTLSALRGRNAILFGAPVDSEAISRTMERTPLIVDYEPSVKGFVIRDRTSGQMIVPQKDGYGDFIDVYGLITVLNARDSDRGNLGMVVFSGITSAGTHGAAEFFSSARALHNLRAIFAREGVNGFPAAYQVVVKCTFSDLLLVAYEYHSHRILQRE